MSKRDTPLGRVAAAHNRAMDYADREARRLGGGRVNPKTIFGKRKPSLENVPTIAMYVLAQGMDDGQKKYGQLNYRENEVLASVYIEAAKRHLNAWQDREELADDSNVHHLGHVMACCAILIDAQLQGCLKDDRPDKPKYSFADFVRDNTVKAGGGDDPA